MDLIAIGNGGGNGFGVKLVELPVKQADADSASYVVDAVGAAGTNLTGAGGGLTGADLVLTQYGNVGTDGVNRTIADESYQCFVGTYGLYSMAYNSADGFTIIHRVSDIDGTSQWKPICNLNLNEAGNSADLTYSIAPNSETKTLGSLKTTLAAGIVSAQSVFFPEAGQDYMIILSVDYASGLCFSGIKIDDGKFPRDLAEMKLKAINTLDPVTPSATPLSACHITATGSQFRAIAGGIFSAYTSWYSGGHTLRHITVSKKPCLVPA